jgi:hypothetical protein
MKSFAFFRAAAIGLILIGLGALVPMRSQNVITSGAQALWNGNELYIFVEQNKLAWSQNLWSFSWSAVKSWMTAATPPSFHRIDSTVYRVTSTALEERLAKGWQVAGSIAPYKGVPHAFMGVDRNWNVYRWTGTDFVQLSASERFAAKSGYTYMDELFKREGWTQSQVLPVRGSADHTLTLGGTPFLIRAAQTEDGTSRIEIVSARDPNSTRVVYQFKNVVGLVSATEYKHLTE